MLGAQLTASSFIPFIIHSLWCLAYSSAAFWSCIFSRISKGTGTLTPRSTEGRFRIASNHLSISAKDFVSTPAHAMKTDAYNGQYLCRAATSWRLKWSWTILFQTYRPSWSKRSSRCPQHCTFHRQSKGLDLLPAAEPGGRSRLDTGVLSRSDSGWCHIESSPERSGRNGLLFSVVRHKLQSHPFCYSSNLVLA